MAIYDHFIPSGFEVDQLNAAAERESALVQGKSVGPRATGSRIVGL